MAARPLLLCPIDFSSASRGALRHALAIANHFSTRLLLLTVDDPILEAAANAKLGAGSSRRNSERELRLFLAETLGPNPSPKDVEFEVATGKPAVETLRVAGERKCAAIVMSTHGRAGPRKLFFGSTAERVLRETTVPVLLTPAADGGAISIDALTRSGAPVLVPVDLSGASARQLETARTIAAVLKLPLLLAHIVEPLHPPVELDLPELTAERRLRARVAIAALTNATPLSTPRDSVIEVGDAAGAIACLARDRHAGLIVIGLHGSPALGPRMGSVTYRVLCQAPVLTLALPPEWNPSGFN